MDDDQLKEDEDARKVFLTCAVLLGMPVLVGVLCSTWVVYQIVTWITTK